MTQREIVEGCHPKTMPPLMRQAAITENLIFLRFLAAKENLGTSHQHTKRLGRLHLMAFSRFFRRKDKEI